MKRSNIHISGDTKTEQKKNCTEAIFEELMTMNFPKLMENIIPLI